MRRRRESKRFFSSQCLNLVHRVDIRLSELITAQFEILHQPLPRARNDFLREFLLPKPNQQNPVRLVEFKLRFSINLCGLQRTISTLSCVSWHVH